MLNGWINKFWRTHSLKVFTSLFSVACTDSKFDFGSVRVTMYRMRHSRNHPSFAVIIASSTVVLPGILQHRVGDSSATPLRVLFATILSEHHPLSPCCYLTFLPPPLSLAIPFLRCWTITLSRKAVAAITSAPKLLRHLGASLVLLRRNGNQRGGRGRRKTGEVKEKRRRKRDREERGGSRVRWSDVLRSHCIHGIP